MVFSWQVECPAFDEHLTGQVPDPPGMGRSRAGDRSPTYRDESSSSSCVCMSVRRPVPRDVSPGHPTVTSTRGTPAVDAETRPDSNPATPGMHSAAIPRPARFAKGKQ
ncbi:hypothetical protein GCM10027030_30990 [Luteococcus sediminum]